MKLFRLPWPGAVRIAPPPEAVESETGRLADAMAEFATEAEADAHRRDRLLSGLILIGFVILLLGAPFALQAGAGFFLPMTAALVIALVLIPGVEWLQRRGLGEAAAAALALLGFVAAANAILVSIVIPAIAWMELLPSRLEQARANLAPLLETYAFLERFLTRVGHAVGARPELSGVMNETPAAVVGFITAAPTAILQVLFTLLLVFFMLTNYTRARAELSRQRHGAPRTIRVALLLRDVVRATAAYIFTITIVNVGLGAAVAFVAWAFGLPTPLMWGGLAALFNFVPYVGPLVTGALLLLAGLAAFSSPLEAMMPAIVFLGLHLVEANLLTPSLVGRRLTMSPLAILISLSFWGWVWGAVGALLSVPLLIMGKVFLDHVGAPDVLGFLFRDGTLVRDHAPREPAAGGSSAAA